jgi:hypothetical protein
MITLISNTAGQRFIRGVTTNMVFNTVVTNDLGIESDSEAITTAVFYPSNYTFPTDGIKIPVAGVYYLSVSICFAAQTNLHPAIHQLQLYHVPEDTTIVGQTILAICNRSTVSNFDIVMLNLSTTARLYPTDIIGATFSISAGAPADLAAATALTANCFDAHLSASLLTTI